MTVFMYSTIVECIQNCLLFGDLCYRVPGITIATDIICGFPTETDEVSHCLLPSFPHLLMV